MCEREQCESGWCPSSSSVCRVEWRWGVLLPVYPSPVCVACAVYSPVHTVSTARSCRVLFLVGSRTVRVVSISPRSLCGGVSSVHPPPRRGGGGGHCGWWGVCCGGGRHSDGRAVVLLTSRLRVGALPFCLPGGPVEWREWCVL